MLKQIIPIDSEKGMFAGVPYVATPEGKLIRSIDTEVMPSVTLKKTKMSALMPVLDWIEKDWGLDLTQTHDRTVAFRILKNSVIKN